MSRADGKRKDEAQYIRQMARAALFAALTATGAFFTVPLPISAVPFTLQVMFTLMAGLLLGGRIGAYSQIVYVILGLIGLPVFSKGGAGVGVLLGPTGGYLIGFVLGAGVAGVLADLTRKLTGSSSEWRTVYLRAAGYLVAALVGIVVIYTLGVWRLAAVLDIGWRQAVVAGALPFVAPDLIKALAAAFLVIALERRGLRPWE